MNLKTACTVSIVSHAIGISVLACIPMSRTLWDYSVQHGKPLTLVVSMTASSANPQELVPFDAPATPPRDAEQAFAIQPQESQLAKSENQLTRREVAEEERTMRSWMPSLPIPEVSVADREASDPPPLVRARRAPHSPAVSQVAATVAEQQTEQLRARKFDQAPRKLPINPAPEYPFAARAAGEEGLVQLLVTIQSNGSVNALELYESSGYPLLDQAAQRTVKDWKFAPARQAGRAVEAQVVVQIRFAIRRAD